jgi:hypothetical protein
VYVLAAVDAEGYVARDWVESVLAHAAFVFVTGGGEEWFAVFLQARFEECGGEADEVFMDSEAAGEVGDLEVDGFAAGAAVS